jgi:hypothetical protein
MLYYDGLGMHFLKELQRIQSSEEENLFNLNKVEHRGITDTGPAFMSITSGLNPFTYVAEIDKIGIPVFSSNLKIICFLRSKNHQKGTKSISRCFWMNTYLPTCLQI